jgi:hypothetical protein
VLCALLPCESLGIDCVGPSADNSLELHGLCPLVKVGPREIVLFASRELRSSDSCIVPRLQYCLRSWTMAEMATGDRRADEGDQPTEFSTFLARI